MRIGLGYDVHQLVPDRKLWLGGIEIPHTLGLLGHSDADVLLHAICDALLGAAALGDIGKHFPDNDPKYKNIDSIIVAQKPKVGPYIPQMRECIASILGIEPGQVSVKATTTEHLGFEGHEEGISAHAIALLLPA